MLGGGVLFFFFNSMRIGDGRDYGLTIYLGVSETKDAHAGAWALVSAPSRESAVCAGNLALRDRGGG